MLLKSVLLSTLIVVCICGCNKGTAQYISSEEKGTSEEAETQSQQSSTEDGQQENAVETVVLYV